MPLALAISCRNPNVFSRISGSNDDEKYSRTPSLFKTVPTVITAFYITSSGWPIIFYFQRHHGARQVAAAALGAIGKTGLVDIESRVKGLDGDQQIDGLETSRQLATEIDQSIPGIAGDGYQNESEGHVCDLSRSPQQVQRQNRAERLARFSAVRLSG